MTEIVAYEAPATEMAEEQLIERLSALLACDGSIRLAVKRLIEDGVEIDGTELKKLRDRHSGMYQALAVERARAQEETIAQEFREITKLSQRATHAFLDDLIEGIEQNTLPAEMKRTLPQIIQALAKTQQVSVDKLLSITGRPQDGSGGGIENAAKVLIDLGVLVPRARPVDITAEEAP